MTPDQAIAALTKKRLELIRNLRAAETKSLREGKTIAMRLSSGVLSTAMLRRLGHPYAATHSALTQDPWIINRQTGLFRRSWRTKIGPFSGAGVNRIDSEIWNEAPYAMFLERGTKRMVARFILARVIKELAPIRRANMQDAVNKTLRS